MKSNFLKLCSMILCGVMLAAVGCTDQLAEDITNVAGEVDAVEATLADLQSKYNALEQAQNDLKAVVALKTQTDEIAKDVAALETAIAALAKAEDVNAVAADVDALEKALKALEAELAKYATTADLQAAVAALAKAEDVTALQAAVKTVKDAVDGLQTRIAKAETELATLKTAQADLKKSVDEILAKLEGVDFTAFMTAADVKAYIAENVKPADLSGLAKSEELAAANAAIAAANAAIENVNAILGTLIGELQKRPQSVVFVPEYDDMAISAYEWNLDGESVNDLVIVKGTYKVSPANTVSLLSDGTLTPTMFAKGLKTRANDADGVMGELVAISNINTLTGTFDVEFVFSNEDVNGATAIALYLSEGEYSVSPLSVDDEMGVTTPSSILANAISSEYVPATFVTYELDEMYVLYNGTKEYKASEHAYKVQWNTVDNAKTALKGYTPYIKIDRKYYTLEEVADNIHANVAVITPKYADAITYTVNTVAEKADDCKAQVVTAGQNVVEREIKINGTVTKETAKDFVGHKVAVAGYFYFGTTRNPNKVIENVDYSYEIVNRQVGVTLEPLTVAWSYDLAKKLSTAYIPTSAYNKPIDGTVIPSFNEVSMTTENTQGYDIKAILNGTPGATKVNGATVTGFSFVPTVVAYQDAQIAKVSVAGYKKMWDGQKKAVSTVYNIAADYTDITVSCDLTLGAIPAATSKNYELTLPLTSDGYIAKSLDITKDLFGTGIAGFANLNEFNEAYFWFLNSTSSVAVWGEGKQANATALPWGDVNTYIQVNDANTQGIRISTNAHLKHADDLFVFNYQQTPWYYAGEYTTKNTFKVKVTAGVSIPSYSIETEPVWVDADNVVLVPGHTDPTTGEWVINDAKLNTYVNVKGVNATSTDKLYVKWEVLTKADATKGYANIPTPTVVYSEYNAASKTIAESIIVWGDYTALDLDVKATLVMKKHAAGAVVESNLLVVGEPIEMTLKTNNMIHTSADATYSVERNSNNAVTASFADGLSIFGLDASEGSIDYETVQGKRVQKNFIVKGWQVDPLLSAAVEKYGLALNFDAASLKVIVDGGEYDLSKVNYVAAADFAKTGKFTFQSNDAVLNKDITFAVDATVTYNRDYNGKNQAAAPTKVKLYVTIKK